MKTNDDLVIRAGETAHGQYAVDITPERAGWRFSGIKIVVLDPGSSHELSTGEDEALVLPLSGSCSVEVEGTAYDLAGRLDVFTAITDYIYLPRETTVTIASVNGGRFAIPTARATRRLGISYRPASDVQVDLRGAGSCSRQVNNYALGNDLDTDHLLVCEVRTPGGNWSSTRRTSMTCTPTWSVSSRRSTTSTFVPARAVRASRSTGRTARPSARSRSRKRFEPVTSC